MSNIQTLVNEVCAEFRADEVAHLTKIGIARGLSEKEAHITAEMVVDVAETIVRDELLYGTVRRRHEP